jgi:hypothetical protein
MSKKYHAAELIGRATGSSFDEIVDGQYQPSVYTPAVYVLEDSYYTAPAKGRKPHANWSWEVIWELDGRKIYKAVGGPSRKPLTRFDVPRAFKEGWTLEDQFGNRGKLATGGMKGRRIALICDDGASLIRDFDSVEVIT